MDIKLRKNVVIIAAAVLTVAVFAVTAIVRSHRRDGEGGPKVFVPNKPVAILDLQYGTVFNDLNPVQLEAAVRYGIEPVADRAAAERLSRSLVEISDNPLYKIDPLTHSIPFLTPNAAGLLEKIASSFRDSLSSKGINPARPIITSVLRTDEDVKKLRHGNINASEASTHCYATTFDITYARFDPVTEDRKHVYEAPDQAVLKAVMGQVLRDLRDRGLCYVKYERKQPCFHITSRK